MYLRKSNVHSHKLGLQETNFSSLSSIESEDISLDACPRMDGIHAFDLWDLGIIFSVCSVSAFSALPAAPKRCRKECSKEQEKIKLWQSRIQYFRVAISAELTTFEPCRKGRYRKERKKKKKEKEKEKEKEKNRDLREIWSL